ncbi:MAG: DUF3105 domain-containing protein [Gammaproteobacteria bacterium]|nr:MAG: DUF3105 domain-containing protein [Gammaproteobacteria bacterium]
MSLFSASAFAAQPGVIAYVANAGNNNVQLLDTASGETLNKLYTGAGPWRLVKSPDGKKMIVQNWYSETSAVVDLASNNIDAVLPVRGPSVYDPKGKRLWTQSWPAAQLQAIDAKTFKPVEQRDSEDRMVYDMALWEGMLVKGQYDPVSKTGRRAFTDVLTLKLDDPKAYSAFTPAGASPARLVVDPTGEFLLTANYDDRDIAIINSLGDGRRISLAYSPRDIVFNKKGKQMIVITWAKQSDESEIFTLDTDFKERPWPKIKAQNSVRLRGGFVDAEMGPDGLLYVLDQLGKRLVAFDPDSLQEKKSFAVGDEPWAFTLRQVSAAQRAALAKKTKARRQLEQIIAGMQAKLTPFKDAAFTETLTQKMTDIEALKAELEKQAKKKNVDEETAKKEIAKKLEQQKDVITPVKTQIRLPDSVRQETPEGRVRLAQGGRVITITKDGRFNSTPRQELLHVLYTAPGLSVEEVVRQLAGDVPGSPFLRNGIAVDIVRTVKEQSHTFYAIGAKQRGEFVSQLWVDAQTGLPLDLVEQYPVTRSRSPHKEGQGFQGLAETKLHYHERGGRYFLTEMTRYLDGEKLGDVVISDVKLDQNLSPEKFRLAALGGVLKPHSKPPKTEKAKNTGPGLAVASLGTAHVDSPLDEHPPYNSNPPTSGHHTRYTAEPGVHKLPIPPEVQVSNLINGAVLAQYNCPQGCEELVKKLEALVDKYGQVIVAPYPLMDSKIALTAWQRIETLKDYDEKRIGAFIEAYSGKKHPHNPEDLPQGGDEDGMMMPPNHPPMQGGSPMMPRK